MLNNSLSCALLYCCDCFQSHGMIYDSFNLVCFLQITYLCCGLISLQELLGFMLHYQMVFQLWVPDTRQPQLDQTPLTVQHG